MDARGTSLEKMVGNALGRQLERDLEIVEKCERDWNWWGSHGNVMGNVIGNAMGSYEEVTDEWWKRVRKTDGISDGMNHGKPLQEVIGTIVWTLVGKRMEQ